MRANDEIITYLMETYRPEAVIVYGSQADGSAGAHSDFDALVIAEHEPSHDESVIDGTVLDVFIYPPRTFSGDFDPEDFVQVFDGKIVLDQNGTAARLQQRVLEYISAMPKKTAAELRQELAWCEKMLARTARADAEGYYRWHWLLCDSLEICFDIMGQTYYGPKKAQRQLKETDGEAFEIYTRALKEFTQESLAAWIACLKSRAAADEDYSHVRLETRDLVLKKAVYEDWEPLYRNLTYRPESARFMLWQSDENEQDARARMLRTLAYEKREKYALLVYRKDTMEAIGFAAMREAEPGVYEEMGIAVGPAYVRKGFGRQILDAFCREAARCGARQFRASFRMGNLAGAGLLAACGFAFDFDSEERIDPRTGESYVVRNMKKDL